MKKFYGITSVDVQTLENNEFFQLMSESRRGCGIYQGK